MNAIYLGDHLPNLYISSSSSRCGNSIGRSAILPWLLPLSSLSRSLQWPRYWETTCRAAGWACNAEAESNLSKSSSWRSTCNEAILSKLAKLNHRNLLEARPSSDKISSFPNWRWEENFCKRKAKSYKKAVTSGRAYTCTVHCKVTDIWLDYFTWNHKP